MRKQIRVSEMRLKNFRLFEQLNITFDSNLTVFIGVNGAGKTTILEALAGSLQYIKEQLQDKPSQGEFFKDTDIKIGEDIDTFEIAVTLNKPSLSELIADYTRRNRTAYNFVHQQSEDSDILKSEDKSIESDLQNWYNDNKSLEILAYYPCQSVSVENSELVNFKVFNAENAYDEKLDGRFNFELLKKWLIWQYNLKQEQAKNKLFDNVVAAIVGEKGILNDEEERHFSELRVTYKYSPEGSLFFEKDDIFLQEHQLSSGEKLLFSLVADIARRLITANPKSENPLEEGSGVVLIDEIDLHLHPKWQRKVLVKLRELFPNVQFIVTTHSAEVLKGLDRKNVRIIKNGGIISVVPYLKGRDNDSINLDFFEIPERFPQDEAKLKQFYDLVQENKIEAKKILDDLISQWGETDEEVIRANSYFEIF